MADIKKTIANALAQGFMAMGEGMTGRPFLSNWQEMKNKEAEREFKKYQQEKLLATGVPVYTFNQEGGVQQVGNVPRGAKVVPPAQMETGEQRAETEINKQISAEAGKKSAESQRNFLTAKNKLRTTMAAFKAMSQVEGAGRVGGAKRLVSGATGINPYVKAYEGQLVEAAAALAKLAAPSARVGQEIIQQFKKTLPTKWSTMDEAANQIRFSLHNAFSTALGQSGESYSPEMQAQVDSMVDEIVNVEPMTLNSLNQFKSGKEVKYIKTGMRNGKKIGMLPDGTIEEIKNGK